MIINTGSRTDTVQYYTKWLLKRFEEGFVYSRNPMYPNIVNYYKLSPDVVDCVIFCSKNYEPILPYIAQITQKFNTYFFYTITAYRFDIEPNVPEIEKSVETLKKLSTIVGKRRIAWRYDPILLTDRYTKEIHYHTFDYLSNELSPYIDRCIFSFVDMYKKLKNNMEEIILLEDSDKDEIAKNLGAISQKRKMIIQTCAEDKNYQNYGILASGCITKEILEKANDIKFKKIKPSKSRKNCKCIENRNIGDYNTCPNGCRYCYANQNPKIALINYKKHNENSPLILGELSKSDKIVISKQESYLEKSDKSCQIKLSF